MSDNFLQVKVTFLLQENARLREALLDAQIRLGDISLDGGEDA